MPEVSAPVSISSSGEFTIPGVPCGNGLPVATAVDVYHFYRFIELNYQLDNSQARVRAGLQLSAPVSQKLSVSDPRRRGLWPVLSASGALLPQQGNTPLTVAINDTDSLIASRRVRTAEGDFTVMLTPSAVQQLLAGQPAAVYGQSVADPAAAPEGRSSGLRSLVLNPPGGAEPTGLSIANLESFLAEPALDIGGGLMPLSLTPYQVRTLRNGDTAIVDVHGLPVRLQVAQPGQDAEPGAPAGSAAAQRVPTALIVPASLQISPGIMVPIVFWLPWTQTWSLTGC